MPVRSLDFIQIAMEKIFLKIAMERQQRMCIRDATDLCY